ncbi:MAG: PilZ domain-containing protein [Candidatus Rokubacteria bacterium]|nr:PilZ domain-containing protein [Candidatus Rokubacteria bacterium]
MDIRPLLFEKLAEVRTIIERLGQQGEVGRAPLEWEKGYARALEDMLALKGISLRRSPRRTTMIAAEIARKLAAPGAPPSESGTITDLSLDGCSLATMMEVAVGDLVVLTFTLPEPFVTVRVEGWVRRADRIDGTLAVGVEFMEPPEEVSGALKRFLDAALEADPEGRP